MEYLFYFGIPALIIFLVIKEFTERQAKLSKGYDWYRKTYPGAVNGHRVLCFSCKGPHIGTEREMNRSYLRRHYCRNCGTSLYWSRET